MGRVPARVTRIHKAGVTRTELGDFRFAFALAAGRRRSGASIASI